MSWSISSKIFSWFAPFGNIFINFYVTHLSIIVYRKDINKYILTKAYGFLSFKTMNTYIPPYSDFFIKFLLGSEKNKDLLLSFINAVLTDSELTNIIDIEIRNPFNIKTFRLDKESILDVKATDDKGKQYNIEVQAAGDEGFKHRSLYYWARLYISQVKEKETYGILRPTICINVLNFNIFPELTAIHNCFLLREKEKPEYILTDHLTLHFLELPKITEKTIKSKLEKWLYFLKNEGSKEDFMKILIQDDKDIAKAHREYEHFSADDEMRELYEQRMRWQLDYNTDLENAEQKGMEKGMEKGKLEDAQKMLKEGLDIALISRITGLSTKEIQKLQGKSS